DEPVEQVRTAMLAEAPLAPFRRVIAADVLGAFEAHVRAAVDRKQRPTRPAATHRTVADANLVLGILDGEAHGAAKAGAGLFRSIAHRASPSSVVVGDSRRPHTSRRRRAT